MGGIHSKRRRRGRAAEGGKEGKEGGREGRQMIMLRHANLKRNALEFDTNANMGGGEIASVWFF